MARLRTSLVTAINYTKEQIEKNKVSLEEAAHQAALTYNENEQEVIQKVRNSIEKEQKKTTKGKPGRPRKNTTENNNTKSNKNVKATTSKKKEKMAADNIKEEKDQIEKRTYTFEGEVSIKANNTTSKLRVIIPTKEVTVEKAYDAVLNKFFEMNIPVFISSKDFAKSLKN